jgi:hypothetical protein
VGDWIDDRIQRGREAIGDEIVFDIIMNVGLAVDEVQIVPGVVEERWQRKVTRRSGDEAVGIAADFLNERRPGNGKGIFIQKSDSSGPSPAVPLALIAAATLAGRNGF